MTHNNYKILPKDIATCTLAATDYPYSGIEIETSYLVKDEERNVNLTKGTDFTVESGDKGTDISTYTLTINGKGNYTGTTSTEWKIEPLSFTGNTDIVLSKTQLPYTGEIYSLSGLITIDLVTRKPDGTVVVTPLPTNQYTLSSDPLDIKEVGSYTITIAANPTGVYTGSTTRTLEVVPRSFTKAELGANDLTITFDRDPANYPYTGSPVEPVVTITDSGRKTTAGVVITPPVTLVKDTDYEVAYADNTDASDSAKVTITGKGNYADSIEKTFSIGTDLSTYEVTLTPDTFEYNGAEQKPTVVVKKDSSSAPLVEGTDYDLVFANDSTGTALTGDVGTKYVTVKGKGSYYGKIENKTYTITPKTVTTVKAKLNEGTYDSTKGLYTGFTYKGEDWTPGVTVTETTTTPTGKELVLDQDYTVAYNANKNAGTAKVNITAKNGGNYQFSPVEVKFAIDQLDLSNGSLSLKTAGANAYLDGYDYTGNAITPDDKVTVMTPYGNTLTLTKAAEYTAKYVTDTSVEGNNTNPGKSTITIQAVEGNNYKGSFTKDFYIYGNLGSVALAPTVVIKDQFFTGGQIIPAAEDISLKLGSLEVSKYDAATNPSGGYEIGNVTSGSGWAANTYANVELNGVLGNYYYGTANGTYLITTDASQIAVHFVNAPSDNETNVVKSTGKFAYTGSAIDPGFTLKSGTTDLSTIWDWTITETAPDGKVNAGSKVTITVNMTLKSDPTVTAVLNPRASDGTTEGVADYTYMVSKKNLNDSDVKIVMSTGTTAQARYTGSEIKPKISIVYNNELLTAGTDYEVVFTNNIVPSRTEPGAVPTMAVASISGLGNYYADTNPATAEEEPIEKSFEILMTKVSGLTALTNGTTALDVSFNRAAHATEYIVDVKDASTGEIIVAPLTTTSNAFTIDSLPEGGDYVVEVAAVAKVNTISYVGETVSSTGSTNVSTPAINTATSPAPGKAKLGWNKSSSISGVEIYRAKNSDGSDMKRIADVPLPYTEYTDAYAKSGNTYYYFIRAYKISEGEIYYSSSFSSSGAVVVQ